MRKITFDLFAGIFLRFLWKGPKWHGEVNIKFYEGKITNVKATDSEDIEQLRDTYVVIDLEKQTIEKYGLLSKESNMLVKNGVKNNNSDDSKIEKVEEASDTLKENKKTETKEKKKELEEELIKS